MVVTVVIMSRVRVELCNPNHSSTAATGLIQTLNIITAIAVGPRNS